MRQVDRFVVTLSKQRDLSELQENLVKHTTEKKQKRSDKEGEIKETSYGSENELGLKMEKGIVSEPIFSPTLLHRKLLNFGYEETFFLVVHSTKAE